MAQFVHGGGPVLGGPVWPFISITIAQAPSPASTFIGSGTTPKLVDKWNDIPPVAFGAMLAECVVGVMALIAATALHPADYRHQRHPRPSPSWGCRWWTCPSSPGRSAWI